MNVLDALSVCRGEWQGTNTLHDPTTGQPESSDSRLSVTPLLGNKFVRMDYTWVWQGKPQEGSLLVGFDSQADAVTACWIDSWHMGEKVLLCQGPRLDGPSLRVRGSYAAPPGPDWGWRIEITPDPTGELRIAMYNIWPDGVQEAVAVEASYTRIS